MEMGKEVNSLREKKKARKRDQAHKVIILSAPEEETIVGLFEKITYCQNM